MGAICDGGDEAWKIMQVSARVKIINKQAIDPHTGELFLGEISHTSEICHSHHSGFFKTSTR